MTTVFILAHHLEAHHVVIATALFATGSCLGWLGTARWQGSPPRNRRLS